MKKIYTIFYLTVPFKYLLHLGNILIRSGIFHNKLKIIHPAQEK